ncbi:efflux RND transporter periplasmic adaptor subunit [Rhizorhabdus sp. FW153]|uniref:efflux RND transporter periplasmic adaptor subunit n=1 Tax=Rhizorhabdus sp. FW153 TaxID=3400216 RepID=UPI003CF1EDBC
MKPAPIIEPSHRRRPALLVAFVLLSLAGCGGREQRDKGPPEVGYRVLQFQDVPYEAELPGRTTAVREAEVRPQITGVVRRRLFEEGQFVRAGQPLYEIDPSLYRAAVQQASANLAAAEALAKASRKRADRLTPLASVQAVSQQDFDDAVATSQQAAAAVAQNRAALETARINLRFTTVPAPVSGIIGRSLLTEGALVSVNQVDPMARISVLDPINVDIQQNATDLFRLRRLALRGGQGMGVAVRLKLDDGEVYPVVGRLQFTEVSVATGTSTVTLRARFANSDNLLLPGMFVRAMLEKGIQRQVMLVPQSALGRDAQGRAQVLLVGKGNKAEQRLVTAERTVGSDWVVTTGLKPGDKLITQGLGKARPDQPVKPVPDTTPQRPKPAKDKTAR